MKQYLELIKTVKELGTLKPAAREGQIGTLSYFGYQFRHKLSDGFPLLTTKKVSFKNIVVELLWFLKGDTNIKFLDEYNVRKLWHEDAYRYYVSIAKANTGVDANGIYRKNDDGSLSMFSFEEFCDVIKNTERIELPVYGNYILGDCGFQYGKVWRDWDGYEIQWSGASGDVDAFRVNIDQIVKVLTSLIKTPESRRHIVTAVDPANDEDLALYWCHALFQFNCRPLTESQRLEVLTERLKNNPRFFEDEYPEWTISDALEGLKIPKYYLDCQLYQRSADLMLGVPYNIASYALIIELFAKWTNMIPGDFIHTFGDAHIYENHIFAINEQLTREPLPLPKVNLPLISPIEDLNSISKLISNLEVSDFVLETYTHHEKIEAKLSTGLK